MQSALTTGTLLLLLSFISSWLDTLRTLYLNDLADCACDPVGTKANTICDKTTGECECLPNVGQRQCNRCEDNYQDLRNPDGCRGQTVHFKMLMTNCTSYEQLQTSFSKLKDNFIYLVLVSIINMFNSV